MVKQTNFYAKDPKDTYIKVLQKVLHVVLSLNVLWFQNTNSGTAIVFLDITNNSTTLLVI